MNLKLYMWEADSGFEYAVMCANCAAMLAESYTLRPGTPYESKIFGTSGTDKCEYPYEGCEHEQG